MSVQKVVDKTGRVLNLRVMGDGMYGSPQFNQYACEHMTDFPLRHDDIILVSYPKNGCHWSWEILRILVHGEIEGHGFDKSDYMMEWLHPEQFETLPSPRVLNNHMPFHLQPKELLDKKPKIVLFYRNLKDTAVSFFHHHCGIKEYEYQGDDFGAYLQRFVDGQVESGNPFKFMREWDEAIRCHPDLHVCLCAYEDMKQNPMREMRRVAEFLGKDYDNSFLQKACNATSFDSMKKTQGVVRPVFYRKGQVGDWTNHFTVAQNTWFDGLLQSELPDTDTKINFRYTLDSS